LEAERADLTNKQRGILFLMALGSRASLMLKVVTVLSVSDTSMLTFKLRKRGKRGRDMPCNTILQRRSKSCGGLTEGSEMRGDGERGWWLFTGVQREIYRV
jgi:hypothetical protein